MPELKFIKSDGHIVISGDCPDDVCPVVAVCVEDDYGPVFVEAPAMEAYIRSYAAFLEDWCGCDEIDGPELCRGCSARAILARIDARKGEGAGAKGETSDG